MKAVTLSQEKIVPMIVIVDSFELAAAKFLYSFKGATKL